MEHHCTIANPAAPTAHRDVGDPARASLLCGGHQESTHDHFSQLIWGNSIWNMSSDNLPNAPH
jgi:hypothetical protein